MELEEEWGLQRRGRTIEVPAGGAVGGLCSVPALVVSAVEAGEGEAYSSSQVFSPYILLSLVIVKFVLS